jgi:plastocyanin
MRLANLIVPFVLAPLVSCGGGGGDGGTNPPPPGPVNSVTLDRSTATMRIGDPASTFTATAKDANNTTLTGKTVTWSVSQSGVVNITPNGASVSVTAAALGTTDLIATIEQKTGKATITVTNQSFPGSATVTVSNNNFDPSNVDIALNGTVTWSWAQGAVDHNVTFGSGPATVSNISQRSTGSDSRTFSVAGTYPYQCTLHTGMTGTVVVH